ncbi:hypothetical protein [Oryzobacter terrae]|uniref:hypothetical protein n=1 Tax=Oryzobacter terrae TaxID=1620385 RepID=UPI0036727840
MFTTEILETVLTAAAAGALLAPVVALMERTHRRMSLDNGGRISRYTDGRGTDRRDADTRRVRDELRARAAEEPATATTTAPVAVRRREPSRSHGVRTVRTHHAR